MRCYCHRCGYPAATCVCAAVSEVASPVDLVVLQHPKEASHAKNTVRLAQLALPGLQVISSDDTAALADLQHAYSTRHSGLIYPSAQSAPLESAVFTQAPPQLLVVLDGSWGQAYRLLQQHPWLSAQPQWHLSQAPASRYAIRHTSKAASLSSLEAIAYTLQAGYGVNSTPLLHLQDAMQAHWQGPAHHRR